MSESDSFVTAAGAGGLVMADHFWLSDAQWIVIERFMPIHQPGARLVDDRRIISGILHVIRSGCRYGTPVTI